MKLTEVEAFFKSKYGNELKASDSWVLRFAEEYAQFKTEELKKEVKRLKGSLNVWVKGATIGEIKETQDKVKKYLQPTKTDTE